jgi:transcriptional regulator with XRE-family HTH domain
MKQVPKKLLHRPLSDSVRDLRSRLGWSQQVLAVRLNMALRTTARWEAGGPIGRRGLLDLQQLARESGYQDLEIEFQRGGLATVSTDPNQSDVDFWTDVAFVALLLRAEPALQDESCRAFGALECLVRLASKRAHSQDPLLVHLVAEASRRNAECKEHVK